MASLTPPAWDDVRVDLVDLGGAEPTVRQGTVDDPGDGGECLQL